MNTNEERSIEGRSSSNSSSNVENYDDDMSGTNGMMLLSNAVNERSEDIMRILGSEEKYESLMELVKSFRECEDKMDAFIKLWDSVDEAHTAIQYLQKSPQFFAAFLQTRQTSPYGYGGSLLLREYALMRFSSGRPPNDIRRML